MTGSSASDGTDEPSNQPPDCQAHISEVSPHIRALIRDEIETTIKTHFQPLDSSISVEEVYVKGSFADGTATAGESDLDVRIIVTGDISEEQAEWMAGTIKSTVLDALPEDRPFKFVDPQVYPARMDMNEGDYTL